MGESSNILPCPNSEVIMKGTCLTRTQQLELIKEVTAEEIFASIKSMPTDKVSGVDGFPIEFFTQYWEEVKSDVLEDVLGFFQRGKMNNVINCTAMTLIPKVPTHTQVKDYRPLLCCTTLYKIITEVITRRLKTVICVLV